MTAGQALQYSLGFLYWFTGWSYLIYLALPVLFLLGGFQPITTPNQYPGHFLPYVAASLFTIVYASNFQVTFDALWFTLASFPVMVKALVVTVFGGTAKFVVTPKEGGAVSFKAVRWHLVTCAVLLASAVVGIARYGLTPSVFNNVAWIIAHMVILLGFVWPDAEPGAHASRGDPARRGTRGRGGAGTNAAAHASRPPRPQSPEQSPSPESRAT